MKENAFAECLRKCRGGILLFAVITAADLAVFFLYGLPLEAFLYAELLAALFGAALFAVALVRELRKQKQLESALQTLSNAQVRDDGESSWNADLLPPAETWAEASYREIIAVLDRRAAELEEAFFVERQDMEDYYTAWVHQIKTPIAVMKLKLSGGDSELLAELFRIEQYVDMVLDYMRLGSETNDLVVEEYALDPIIRESVRKFAPQFIMRKLKLEYEGTDEKIVTDKKWLGCILDQLLSNAVKYTPSGSVRIRVADGVLTVSDTGIGIAPEDLPRIFEKGYTGLNGRTGRRSSGLGLFLAKKAADKLAISLRAESAPGQGSTFILDSRRKKVI